MRTIFYLILIFLLFSGCCKEEEEIIKYPSLIGSWDIIQVDSCYLSSFDGTWRILSSLQDTGSIVFNRDSSGSFFDPIRLITCGEIEFIWRHDINNELIDFYFSNGATVGILKTFKKDTVEMYLRDYCSTKMPGYFAFYFNFLMIRKK